MCCFLKGKAILDKLKSFKTHVSLIFYYVPDRFIYFLQNMSGTCCPITFSLIEDIKRSVCFQ